MKQIEDALREGAIDSLDSDQVFHSSALNTVQTAESLQQGTLALAANARNIFQN